MKKVISITLGGTVFAIEQDAYEVLDNYIKQIKGSLHSTDAGEVIEDVERAIAEKFIACKRSEKLAVTLSDVNHVMTEIGSPADFSEGSEVEGNGEVHTAEEIIDEQKKRLYRDTDDAIVAGVASGLAHYFNIDPVIVRLIFVVSIFFNGMGVLVYLILWLVVPVAKTTAEKYAMRGEQVTLKEISERVRKNFQNIDRADIETAKGLWENVRNELNRLFTFLGQVVRYIGIAARYLIGFVFLIGGSLAIAGLVSVYSIVLLSDKAFIPADAQIALDIMLSSSLGVIAILASFVMMLVPFLVLVLLGGGLLTKRNLFTVNKTISLAVVWIVAVVLAGTTSVLQVQEVMPVLNPERFENGEYQIGHYQIHINSEDDRVEIDAVVQPPKEEDVPSAPPSSEPIDLPLSE